MHTDAHLVQQHPAHISPGATFPLDGPGPEQITAHAIVTAGSRPSAANAVQHARDESIIRGRIPGITGQVAGGMYTAAVAATQQQRAASAQRAPLDTTHGRIAGQIDTGLQRRASNNYGHHRQTSVIHGLQHSRNPSFNSPSTASPLSPESLHNANLRAISTMRRAPVTPSESTPTFPTPISHETSHVQSHSIDSAIGSEILSHDLPVLPGRRHTTATRVKKGHVYGSSGSSAELRTPGEFALHHLFHSFVIKADQKINQCLSNLETLAAPVEQVCGKGSDPSFDQLITALGHVARQEPKPLVDSLMLWRKAKGDAASAFKKQLYQHRMNGSGSTSGPIVPTALPRRNTEPAGVDPNGPHTFPGSMAGSSEEGTDEYVQADRRATISVFVLCRVLVEIFEQSDLNAITLELAIKLEDIVFTQLRDVEPAQITQSSLRLANWRIYGELLGHMSRLSFPRVAVRFSSQLDTWQQEIAKSTGTVGARELEMRVELLLHSIRNLQISSDQTILPAVSDFLRLLATLFVDSHGPTIKQAYCQTLEKLLVQVAGEPERLQNMPRFREFSEIVNSRLTQMLPKPRHWSSALPLSTILLCFSPMETFAVQWLQMVNTLSQKLKDRNTRTQAMRAICQLLWTYLHRTLDPAAIRLRRVEEAMKLTFPSTKKNHVTTEASMSEALVYFVRIVGFHYPDLCFRNVIFPLINLEVFMSAREMRIEQMEPEKMVVGIRSFLAMISDLEKGKAGRPEFPTFEVAIPASDGLPMSPNPAKSQFGSEIVVLPFPKPVLASLIPVDQSRLDDLTAQRYRQFCDALGKITIVCDQTFGSSAVLNERFAASAHVQTPKTPLVDAFTLVRKDENLLPDQRQSYYELLHVAIQALPRCFSDQAPLNNLINLLCTGSAHVQIQIASSAARSLKAIAQQGYAQAVAIAFPRFIFQYDSQYSTMSDEGRLGPAHIEATLTLYIELLQIWMNQLRQKTRGELREKPNANSSRALQMEMTNTCQLVDETEAYGLFFLCSQSRRVRAFAVKVLQLILQFDEVLGKEDSARVIRVLEAKSSEILDLDSSVLNVAERIRLEKDNRRIGGQSTIIEISSSENTYDATLWFKGFPNLIRHVNDLCPSAIALSRVVVCDRLVLMQSDVEKLAAPGAGPVSDFRLLGRSAATPTEVFLDQWKLYLIMACVTLSSPGAQSQSQLANAAHVRKTSRTVGNMQEKLSSARALFSAVIPMLGAAPDAIRHAVVISLGAINPKLYRTLLESLQYAVVTCNDEAKARLGSHQRTPSSPHRSQMTERMRTEVTHIYKLTAAFLRFPDVLEEEWVLNNLFNYTRELRIFLSDAEVQNDWRFLKIRCHYCGLVEELYANVGKSSTPSRWMPFESRKSAFTLMEEWCGFAPESGPNGRSEDLQHGPGMHQRDYADRINANAALEKEKNSLRIAALSAMAALCAGPISVVTETNTILQFNASRMLAWTDTIFATGNDKMHAIGQRALRLLLLSNADQPQLIEHAIQQCYGAKSPRALKSYFSVITDVLSEQPKYPIAPTRLLGAVMFTLGNENRVIRMKSASLLRLLDGRQQKNSNLQEFDISISDKTRAVYKRAQFEYSRRLANAHPDLAFAIISEFAFQFRRVPTDHQRNMVAAILPWFQIVELQVDPVTNGPTAVSYMLLSNMLEITVKFSTALHNEVQALWQALATGPHAGNVQMILDFVINLSLDRREQNFVEYAKQIVVHLSTTPAGSRVLEFLLMQLVPKNMINERKQAEATVSDIPGMAYVADLNTVLPMGHKQAGLSLGQVSLIFLVDLMVPPITLKKEDVIRLVHVVAILWDHYTISVQEHAREMLVHLIHELVTIKLTEAVFRPRQHQIEDLVEAIRGNRNNVTWSYEDHAGKDEGESVGNRVPASMTYLAECVADIFGLGHEAFGAMWAKEALHWASICPVRHLACRSFQVFRCISTTLDARMLADMLARLSNTIADEQTDYQTFSLEILTTLRVIITALKPKTVLNYPQLFWTICACLDTIHESEFFEALAMLQQLLARVNFSDPSVVEIFMNGKPAKWEGAFEGLQPLVYKGLRSANCLDRTLSVLHDLAGLPDSIAIAKNDRLLFNVLANLPQFLHSFDADVAANDSATHAARLAVMARKSNRAALAVCLENFAAAKYTNARQCLSETVAAVAASYLPEFDSQSLIFMFSLLTNRTGWFRVKVMDVLCEIIPLIDMRNAAITCHGPDLISPLLRLLQTEHCNQALGVMDHIMEVSCTPMDRHHLRMSMASGSSKAMRKEYERTESLYGIPMPSGWSIPMPAIHSNLTRNNVHAVFFTCGDAETTEEKAQNAPEVEFHKDEGYTETYMPHHSITESMRTLETAIDTNMGDIVNTLDSLDDFFDDTDSAATPTVHDARSLSYFSGSIPENDTITYDEQTAPILSRSLARTSSSLSFQNGLAESRPSTSHQHRQQPSLSSLVFSPQHSFSSIDELSGPGPSTSDIAKALPPTPAIDTSAPVRPGLHARSITSPANQFPASHPTSAGFVPTLPTLSSHQPYNDGNLSHDDAFSDSEGNSPFPLLTTTFSHHVKNASNPSLAIPITTSAALTVHQSIPLSAVEAGSTFSFRRGMRRLTGGKSESAKEKARLRAASGGQNQQSGLISGSSPRVPRVPLEYLNNNVSSAQQQNLSPASASSPMTPETEQKSL